MKPGTEGFPFPRRDLLKAGGALLIGFAIRSTARAQTADGVALVTGPDQPDPNQLDTWIAIHADNTATVFIGFVELGQGCTTALLQLAAEELDLSMSQVKTVRLESHTMPNQGGTVASASVARGGPRIRSAAAEARQALLKMASRKLDAPVEFLTVSEGVVSLKQNPKKSVTYGDLTGDKLFHLPYTGTAPLKSFGDYRVVGQRIPRLDIPDKAAGRYVHMQHVRIRGMLHGRVVRPRGQGAYGDGARVLSVDEGSISAIAGARVIRKRDFIGVVAANEWDAVRAARDLKVQWDQPAALPGSAGLHQQMRASKTTDRVVLENGDINAAFGAAAHLVSQTYRGPYQAHAPFGPNCALADVKADSALVMCSTQNIYDTRRKVAQVLGLAVEKVAIRYYEGSGTYGRSCYDDAAQAAAILSQAAGQPVRVQFMRSDEHGWDNFGPPQVAEVRAAIDAAGKIVAYEFHGWQHNWGTVETSQQLALGTPAAESPGPGSQEVSPFNLGAMYAIPHMRLVNHRVDGMRYLKGANLRSPLDVSFSFASEQTIDELALLAGMDPCEFRRRNIRDEHWLGVLNAVAQAAAWTPRKPGDRNTADVRLATGRGIALGTHTSSYAAAVADIEVDRETGRIVAKHMYGAIDAGLTVNPGCLENQISGMLVQATSRMLKEEVTFSNTNVTSLDWDSYPILRFEECPEVTTVVVQHLDQKSSGGGEELMGPAAAAIANALFDATGVRLGEYPLTPARVLAALGRRTA
jgi:CO/xanthine dehydrogenase Mo-binding subunit